MNIEHPCTGFFPTVQRQAGKAAAGQRADLANRHLELPGAKRLVLVTMDFVLQIVAAFHFIIYFPIKQ